jgi:hypothetical protein
MNWTRPAWVSKQLGQDAIDKQITSEKFEQFSERVKSTTMICQKDYELNYYIASVKIILKTLYMHTN